MHTQQRPWWKGAVVYQVYPRSFFDANGDGTGDLKGITCKLEYIASLGVDAIWLSPFFRSPMKDFGYDISDYCAIDPVFGSMEDFDELLKAAHDRGLRVIIDQVYNHTSDEHPWFVASRSSRENPKADWFIWVDGERGKPPNNWLSYFGGSAWEWDEGRGQYYLHLFVPGQPDLNWRNPEVQNAVMDSLRFWLEKGVDGFRFDVVNLFFKDQALRDNPPCPHAPNVPEFARFFHVFDRDRPETLLAVEAIADTLHDFPGAMGVGEVITDGGMFQFLEYTKPGRLDLAFNFVFKDLGSFDPQVYRQHVARCEELFSTLSWPSYVLGNHDSRRFLSRLPDDGHRVERAKVLLALLFTLRGTPFLYYGEELGMEEAVIPFDQIVDPQGKNLWPQVPGRDGCRTPMQWDDGPVAGFSEGTPWLPVHPNKEWVNVVSQEKDPHSMLNFTRQLLRLRRACDALKWGKLEWMEPNDAQLLSFCRVHDGTGVGILLNFSESRQVRRVAREWEFGKVLFSSKKGPSIPVQRELVLEPFEVKIVELTRKG